MTNGIPVCHFCHFQAHRRCRSPLCPFRGLEFRVDLTAWVGTFGDLVWDLGNEGMVFDEGAMGKWLRFADISHSTTPANQRLRKAAERNSGMEHVRF